MNGLKFTWLHGHTYNTWRKYTQGAAFWSPLYRLKNYSKISTLPGKEECHQQPRFVSPAAIRKRFLVELVLNSTNNSAGIIQEKDFVSQLTNVKQHTTTWLRDLGYLQLTDFKQKINVCFTMLCKEPHNSRNYIWHVYVHLFSPHLYNVLEF